MGGLVETVYICVSYTAFAGGISLVEIMKHDRVQKVGATSEAAAI